MSQYYTKKLSKFWGNRSVIKSLDVQVSASYVSSLSSRLDNTVIKLLLGHIYSNIYHITSRPVHTIPSHIPTVLLIIGAFAQYTLFLYLNIKRDIQTL